MQTFSNGGHFDGTKNTNSPCQKSRHIFSHWLIFKANVFLFLLKWPAEVHRQKPRHEVSNITLPCSLSNTYYFVLPVSCLCRSSCRMFLSREADWQLKVWTFEQFWVKVSSSKQTGFFFHIASKRQMLYILDSSQNWRSLAQMELKSDERLASFEAKPTCWIFAVDFF